MTRPVSIDGEARRPLRTGWRVAIDEGGDATTPDEIVDAAQWRDAHVPGTLAQSLLASGLSLDDLPPLDRIDAWYHTRFETQTVADLEFSGLATLAEVFLDGRLALSSDNMFVASLIEGVAPGAHDLHIRFRSVERELEKKTGRARWRPRMITPAGLRHIRTTALGRLPGFAPPTPPVGPWRAIEIIARGPMRVLRADVKTGLLDSHGTVRVELDIVGLSDNASARLLCEECETRFTRTSDSRLVADLRIDRPKLWSPHTHGAPNLYSLSATVEGQRIDLGRIGFRSVVVDRGANGDDFALIVNGERIFCRGACWTGADAVSLDGSREACLPLLIAARDAGMNMLRIPGVIHYESDDFFALCDELGLMVWQDFAFANFDYPVADEAFRESFTQEATQFLERVQSAPSLVVLCGGSEVYQQASMLGLNESKWRSPLFEELLPTLAHEYAPGAVFVENSPSGGPLPFLSDVGVSHYYGVGAYRREIADARRANVRFASECLGFSCVPETHSLHADFGSAPLASQSYVDRIPRDMGASQTFGDVTEHYMRRLFGCDPDALKRDDPELYLDVARAAVAEAMEGAIGEWRRASSMTHGAIVWFLRDLWPSAGWGVLDSHGEPKSAYYALKRAFRPVQLILTDEGVNGLFVHLINEGARSVEAELTLTCYRDGATAVMRAARPVTLAPRTTAFIRDADLWGAFFDTTLAYNFGPPSHDVTVATLTFGDTRIDAFQFPQGRSLTRARPDLNVAIERVNDEFHLVLKADVFAPSIKIEDEFYRADDNWFHLSPGEKRTRLTAREGTESRPRGLVRALGGPAIRYGG